MSAVVIDSDLSVEEVVAVALEHEPVELSADARARIAAGHRATERLLASGAQVYGLTTGVGPLRRITISREQQTAFNRLLLLSHRTGTGPDVDPAVVRATLLIQVAGFAQGRSGVRESLADLLVDALNRGLAPRARSTGSLGQADLGPLADIAEALTGEGRWSAELERLGLEPWVPDAKEALAFVNSNAFSLASATLALAKVDTLLTRFDQAAALTYEGMLGNVQALDPEIAEARPIPGMRETVARLRAELAGGALLQGGLHRTLQDPLAMRTVPQTHSAARMALAGARTLIEIELVASHDNPCVTPDGRALSNGNFDSSPYGIALDHLRIALAHVATASCERSQKLAHSGFSGLPTGLRDDDASAADGLAIVVYGAAAATAELRLLAMPATLESPTSSVAEGLEDRIIPTPVAARRLHEQIELGLYVVATELYAAAQAVDLRDRAAQLGRGTAAMHALVRCHAPRLTGDEPAVADLNPLIAALADDGRPVGRRLATRRQPVRVS